MAAAHAGWRGLAAGIAGAALAASIVDSHVAIRRDGSVEDIILNKPSGVVIIDQAAMKIVRLTEPFAPLPKNADNIDVLHITRTWDFGDGDLETF